MNKLSKPFKASMLSPLRNVPEDLEAITSNHFLLGRSLQVTSSMPYAIHYGEMRKVFRASQAYAEMIWCRWSREYLPQWNSRSKWNQMQEHKLEVSDSVWLVEDNIEIESRIRNKFKKSTQADMISSGQRWSIRETCGETGTTVLQAVFCGSKQARRCWCLVPTKIFFGVNQIKQRRTMILCRCLTQSSLIAVEKT